NRVLAPPRSGDGSRAVRSQLLAGQPATDPEGTLDAVLMEAVAPVGAAEPGAAVPVELLMAVLGGDGCDIEHRVGVVEPGQYPVVPDGVVPGQRDQDLV